MQKSSRACSARYAGSLWWLQAAAHSIRCAEQSVQRTALSAQHPVLSAQHTLHSTKDAAHHARRGAQNAEHRIHGAQHKVYMAHTAQDTVHAAQHQIYSRWCVVHSTNYTAHSPLGHTPDPNTSLLHAFQCLALRYVPLCKIPVRFQAAPPAPWFSRGLHLCQLWAMSLLLQHTQLMPLSAMVTPAWQEVGPQPQ